MLTLEDDIMKTLLTRQMTAPGSLASRPGPPSLGPAKNRIRARQSLLSTGMAPAGTCLGGQRGHHGKPGGGQGAAMAWDC